MYAVLEGFSLFEMQTFYEICQLIENEVQIFGEFIVCFWYAVVYRVSFMCKLDVSMK